MEDLKNEAIALAQVWRQYVGQTRKFTAQIKTGRRKRLPAITDRKIAVFTKVVAWCRQEDIQPKLWLWCAFERYGWQKPPQLREDLLMSRKLLGPLYGRELKAWTPQASSRRLAG